MITSNQTSSRALHVTVRAQAIAEDAYSEAASQMDGRSIRHGAFLAAIVAASYGLCLIDETEHRAALARFDGFRIAGCRQGYSENVEAFYAIWRDTNDDAAQCWDSWIGHALGYGVLAQQLDSAYQSGGVFIVQRPPSDVWPPFLQHILGGSTQIIFEAESPVATLPGASANDAIELRPAGIETSLVTLADLAAEWLQEAASGQSDESRRRGASTIFIKSVGLMPHSPATSITKIDGDRAGAAFDRLSNALGSRWGTASGKLAELTGSEIEGLASKPKKPAWANHPLSESGRKTRLNHAREFIEFLREKGFAVPPIAWPHSG